MTNAYTRMFVVMAVLVVVLATFGTQAYTQLTLDRSASINVETDANGLLRISSGAPGVTDVSTTGELTIDTARSSLANGVNQNAVLEVGNSAAPTTTYAFSVQNADDAGTGPNRNIEFAYALSGANDGNTGNADVVFEVFDSTGTSLGVADEEGSTVTANGVAPSDTLYVVLTVDTTAQTSSNDLSGTLTITSS